jgi:hypothetical protein
MKAILLLGFASVAAAQASATDPRWQAWLGCWRPADVSSDSTPVLCIVPTTTSSAVDVVTLVSAKEVSRDRLDASGDRRPILGAGCEGWETVRWSTDNRRAFIRSELTCAGGMQRVSTGVVAIARTGELLDLRSLNAGGGTGLRVNRFRETSVPPTFPAEIVDALAGRELAVSTARVAAGAALTLPNVVEAARHLDASALEAFLIERGQSFQLNAKELVSLADAGVPGSVTDVMIALSNPRIFKLARGTGAPSIVGDSTSRSASARRRCADLGLAFDPWAFTPYWGYGMYDPAGCGSYRYGRYGYGGYGFDASPYGWYWNQPTYVIVTRTPEPKAQLIKGAGYTRTDGSSTASSTGSSSGSSSSGSKGHSDGAARTAKPRPN